MTDPKSANEYDERAARAVYSVLLEIGQVLGAYRDHFVLIGGSVPWLLYPDAEPAHVGTMDFDLSLDAEALGDGEYKSLVDLLEAAGYERSEQGMRFFQLRRSVDLDGTGAVVVIVDLLMPREAKFEKNKPPLIANFAVQRADGAAVAMHSFQNHRLEGVMPDGRPNALEIRVASIPALLVMKGYALTGRDKHKDAYDIYLSVREFEGGAQALAAACRPLLDDAIALKGFQNIAEKFAEENAYGPVTVRHLLASSHALGEMTEDQVQVDAFQQVKAWISELGL
ncbi:MAG: nucleotidyl transferase AbiEii/AbiGii toxin family protein [Variovorax sp.]